MDDELGHERVVVRRHVRARAEAGVDPHPRTRRRHPTIDALGVGHELAHRVLGIDAHLDRVPGPRDVVLREAQLHPGRDPYLLLDQVDPGDRLGDRMLDLQASVDLEKEELALAEHELDGACVHVAGGGHGPDRRVAHGSANLSVEGR